MWDKTSASSQRSGGARGGGACAARRPRLFASACARIVGVRFLTNRTARTSLGLRRGLVVALTTFDRGDFRRSSEPDLRRVENFDATHQSGARRNRSALAITDTELMLMAAL